MKALRYLKNKLVALPFANTEYAKEFNSKSRSGAPIGDTLQVPLPTRFLGTTDNNLGYVPQAILQLKSPIVLDRISKIHFEWDSIEAALYIDRRDIADDFVDNPMTKMATMIDYAFAVYAGDNTNNIAGVLGTDPTDVATFAAARQRMSELGGLDGAGDRGALIAPAVNTAAANSFKTLMQPPDEISRLWKRGTIGQMQDFRYYESMGLKRHTAGTWAGAVTIATTVTNGASTLSLTCTNGDTFKRGDKIGINGYYAVNPGTLQTTTTVTTKQVTILDDATAVGTSVTVNISPTLYGPGSPYQNINALPIATTALTLFPGTASPNGKTGTFNLFISSDAFMFLPLKLDNPKEGGNVEIAEQAVDPDTGLAVAFIRWFDPFQRKHANRFDCAYGFGRGHSDAGSVALLSA